VLVVFGGAALLASIANFGDRWDLDDEGLHYANILTGRLGWPRPRRRGVGAGGGGRRAGRHDVVPRDRGEGRWVLDQLDGHDLLRALLQERGYPSARVAPRLLPRLGGGGRTR